MSCFLAVQPKKLVSYRRHFIEIIVVFAIAIFVAAFIFFVASQTDYIPPSAVIYIYIAVLVIGGYLIIRIIARIIEKYGQAEFEAANVSAFKNLFQLVALLSLAVAAMFTLGINVTSALVGAGFLGIVLGLAAQTVLSNVFSGLSLIASKQFELGDRLTITIGQYGFLAQSYVHDDLIPGYTGVVVDIGLTHTKILGDNNVPMSYPNSVLIQSLIFNHTRVDKRTVRIRMDLNRDVTINEFRKSLKTALKDNRFIDCSLPLEINPVTVSSDVYNVSIVAWVKGANEEPGKAELIDKAIEVVRLLREEAGQETYKNLPVRLGDQVSIRGEWGTVEQVTPRFTIVRTWDNRRQTIPNSVLDQEVFINYTLTNTQKLFPVVFYVSYEADLDKAKEIMVDEAQAHPGVLKSLKPIFQVLEFAPNAITLRLLFMAKDQPTAFGAGCDLRFSIKKRFDKEGIRLSRPVVWVTPDSELRVDLVREDADEEKVRRKRPSR